MVRKIFGTLGYGALGLRVAVHRVGRKGGKTDRDVFGATRFRSRVLDPLAAVGHDSLSGADIESAILMLNPEHTLQDDGEFVELRLLARLGPTFGAAHVGNADGCGVAVHASNIF